MGWTPKPPEFSQSPITIPRMISLHAQQSAQQSIDLAKAAGQPPDQNCDADHHEQPGQADNQAGAEQTLQQIAIQNNLPDTWAQLVGVAFGAKGMGNAEALYLYRLLQVTGNEGRRYKELASDASTLGYPTDEPRT